MPSRIKKIPVILFLAAFGCLSSHAAFVYTETFSTGSNGWSWIPPSAQWQQPSFTGGYASITVRPIPFGNLPPIFNKAVLSSTNTASVSGGAFTGNYNTAQITTIGFKYFANKFAYNDPFSLPPTQNVSMVTLRWGNQSNNYFKVFRPSETGVWYSFQADMRCFDEGGWSGSSPGNFEFTRQNVRFVQFEVEGQGSVGFGGTTNTYLIDDIFINTLTNYTARISNQSISFPAIPDQDTNSVLNLSATASSGLPVYFSVLSGPAVIGCCTSVTFTGTGVVSIVATQNGDTNFNAASSVTNTFDVNEPKIGAAIGLDNLSQTYDGTARIVTASTTPTGLSVSITYNGSITPPTNAGIYAITGVVNDIAYQGVATGTLVVAKAEASVQFTSLSEVYNGSARCASVSTIPSNLSVSLTYEFLPSCPTNPDSYLVVATIEDINYTGVATNVFIVAKMPASVQLAGLSAVYDGSNHCVSATTTPTGLLFEISYDGSTNCPVNAGAYVVTAEIVDALYTGMNISTMLISKAAGSISLSNLVYTYTGDDYCAAASTVPTGMVVMLTYNGAGACPTEAGSYAVFGTINNQNYQGSITNTLVINKASQGILFNPLPVLIHGDPPFTLFAYADSGLPVAFASSDHAIGAVTGSMLSIMGTGSVVITASQAGNSNYLAATNVARTLLVDGLVAELDARLSGANMELDVIGNTGRTYTIQHASDLVQSNWQTLVVITNLPAATYQVLDPATNALRHYRLNRPVWTP